MPKRHRLALTFNAEKITVHWKSERHSPSLILNVSYGTSSKPLLYFWNLRVGGIGGGGGRADHQQSMAQCANTIHAVRITLTCLRKQEPSTLRQRPQSKKCMPREENTYYINGRSQITIMVLIVSIA